MEFGWTFAQSSAYERMVQSVKERINPLIARRSDGSRWSPEEWRECAALGFLGLCVPEKYGGSGFDALHSARLIEALGRSCDDMGLVFSACVHLLACSMPLAEHGSEELRQALLPRLCTGELVGAHAITEDDAGSDAFCLKTRAVRDGDDYVVTGTKSWVTNGPLADVIIVYASTSPEDGYLGVSMFAIDGHAAGVRVEPAFDKIGVRTTPSCAIRFDGCRVPATRLLGAEGEGAKGFQRCMLWERSCLFALYLGVMERQLDDVLAYARQRRQFGKTIGRNQAVSHRIVDMKLRLESARLLLYRACWRFDQGEDATTDVALAKLAVSEAAVASGLDSIRLHGGLGVRADHDVERGLRDAVPSIILSGTSELQREIIARAMGL